MKGKIEITCNEQGTNIAVNIRVEKESDRVFLTHALGKALKLKANDYICMYMAEMSGVLDSPVQVSVDAKELMKQLKEKQDES